MDINKPNFRKPVISQESNSKDTSGSNEQLCFFSPESIESLVKRLNNKQYFDRVERNNLILDLIRIKQPISKYEVAKISGLSYGTIKQITKEFAFCGLVLVRVATGDNGLPVKLVYIKEEVDNGN